MDSKKLLITAIVVGLFCVQYLLGRYLPKLFQAILPSALLILIVIQYQRSGLELRQILFLPLGLLFLVNTGLKGMKKKGAYRDESE